MSHTHRTPAVPFTRRSGLRLAATGTVAAGLAALAPAALAGPAGTLSLIHI